MREATSKESAQRVELKLIIGFFAFIICYLFILYLVDTLLIGAFGLVCHFATCNVLWIATYYPLLVLIINLVATGFLVYAILSSIRVEDDSSTES